MKRTMILLGLALLSLLGVLGFRAYREGQFSADYSPPGQLLAIPGGVVHALVRAGPGRAIVFVHGNPGLALDFTPVMSRLPADLSLVAFDRPGYGWSERPKTKMTPLEQAEYLRGALAGLNVSKPVLVGFSFGGPVVLAWAKAHPEEVSALVLLGAVTDPQTPHAMGGAQAMLAKPLLGALMARVGAPFVAPSAVERGYLDAFFPVAVDPAFIERGKLHFARPVTLVSAAHDWESLNHDLAQLETGCRAVNVPLEAVYANQDRVVGISHGQFVEEAVRDAHVVYLEQAGHQLMSTHTDAVVQAVARALDRSK